MIWFRTRLDRNYRSISEPPNSADLLDINHSKGAWYYKMGYILLTNWFEGEVREPAPSAPNIIKGFEELPLCGKAGIDITSPGVWVDGVEGAELGEGPVVLAVPVLLAGPEDDTGCFLFLPVWFFEALKCIRNHVRNRRKPLLYMSIPWSSKSY